MKKQIIKLTESDLHQIIKESVRNILRECDGGIGGAGMMGGGSSGAGDGATNCTGVMQTGRNKKGDENPDAGTYVTSFGADNETSKRSKDFKNNGSMMMQVAPSQARKK